MAAWRATTGPFLQSSLPSRRASSEQYLCMAKHNFTRVAPFAVAAALLALFISPLLLPGLAGASAMHACASGSVRPLAESPEGAAGQAVVFVAVENTGTMCDLQSTLSFAVLERRARVTRVRENPRSYRVHQSVGHGKTVLFDVWWSNWCGSHRASMFRARVTLAHSTAAVQYRVLPACLSRGTASRLTAVSQSTTA